MTQTLALFLDAYRDLNAKKLFWITMILSGIVAASLFFVGINEDGLKVATWQLDNPVFNTNNLTQAGFYKMVFSTIAIRFYFGLAAAVLAIISTAGIFPDMLREGSVDLLLSKPISRLRLFLTRYATGLMFAFLQVFIFTTICFFVIGIRGGVWEPGLFLAVPFFVLFFSYLFAISVLIGTITRSTIAALLITLLVFAALVGINATDVTVRAVHIPEEAVARLYESRIDEVESMSLEERVLFEAEFEARFDKTYDEFKEMAEDQRAKADSWRGVVDFLYALKWPLPKTGETLGLLERTIISAADLPPAELPDMENDPYVESDSAIVEETYDEFDRPVWWVVGTSLVFEFIMVGLAAFRFCRRDY